MNQVHGALAVAVALAALATLVAAVALRIGRRGAPLWLDRAILAAVGLAALNGLFGLVLLALGHAPADLLHLVYGVAALLALPLARWAGRSGDLRRRALWAAGGSAVVLGVLLRLAQTG